MSLKSDYKMAFIGSDKKRLILVIILILLSNISYAAENYKLFAGQPTDICPGSTSLIIDSVESNSNAPLEITVSSSGSANGFSTIIPNGLILNPSSKKSIYSYISPRTTTKTGSYSLNINFDVNGDTDNIQHQINVRNCYDFEISSLKDFADTCPSQNTQTRLELKNTGDYDESYTLEVEGEVKDWITLSSDFLSIKKGESKLITAFITPPSTAEGQYYFSVSAKSQTTGIVKTVESSVIINPCYEFSVKSETNTIEMCERSTQQIDLQLENKGTTTNTYQLQIDGPLWANLDKKSITLQKNANQRLKILLNPDYGVQGIFKIELIVSTDKGNLEGITSYSVIVKKCHDIAINIEKDSDTICTSLSNDYSVNVKNIGEVEKEYILSVIGPSWATIDKEKITLGKNQERSLDLEINPSSDVEPKDYKIIIKAQAFDSSKVSSEDEINIKVVSQEECYKPNVKFQKESIDVNFDSSATVPIVVDNKGTTDATYSLSVTGTASSFAQLNPASLTLPSGKSEVVYLYIAPNSQTPNGNYEATVSARLEDSTILATDSLKITVLESKVSPEKTEDIVKEPSFFSRIWANVKNIFKKEDEVEKEIDSITNETLDNETTSEIIESNKSKAQEEIIEIPKNESFIDINETQTELNETILKDPSKTKSIINKYSLTIIVIVIIILLLFILFRFRKNIMDFFEEEIEEEKPKEQPKEPEKKEIKPEPTPKEIFKDPEEVVLGELKPKLEKPETPKKKPEIKKKTIIKKKLKSKDNTEKYY